MKNVEVNDLRSAIEMLESIPGQLVETDVEVDPNAELSGVYRHVGAGGTVERPTQEGPAMIFNNVKGHEGARVAIGVLSSRKRVGYLLGEDSIMQTCIGPSEEHVSMAGIPTEASILAMVDKALPGKCLNVYNASFGGGKYVTIMQFKKTMPSDEGRQRQAALLAFSAFAELKHVILVDEDVDIFDINDVMWAMTTRFQADVDLITIPGVQCHPLDPSNNPAYHPGIRERGVACKAIFDCTVPFDQKDRFQRAKFMDVDPKHWLPDMF